MQTKKPLDLMQFCNYKLKAKIEQQEYKNKLFNVNLVKQTWLVVKGQPIQITKGRE